MNSTLIIALNTFRETIRNKVLYNILFIAAAVILLSVYIGDWSVFAREQAMQDFGLATMSITSLMLAVFIGVGMLGREISTRTAFTVLTRAVSRTEFLVGKFLGLLATLLLNCAVLSIVLWLMVYWSTGRGEFLLFKAMALVWVEMAVMIAASIFFSTITTPTLAAVFTLSFYIVGHFNDLPLLETAQRQMPWAGGLLSILNHLLPNLEHFNVRAAVVYGLPIPPGYTLEVMLYGVLYTALLLLFSCMIFSRKDL